MVRHTRTHLTCSKVSVVLAPELIAQSSELEMSSTLIGSGGFGQVFAAKYHGQHVAVKRIKRGMAAAECNATLRVTHPNIIRIMVG